jgi:hypothetical protein
VVSTIRTRTVIFDGGASNSAMAAYTVILAVCSGKYKWLALEQMNLDELD